MNISSPSITPQSNLRYSKHVIQSSECFRSGSAHTQQNHLAQPQPQHNNRQSRKDKVSQSGIQGRRIDSPELKVAVNKDMQDSQRPHTAGHPFLMGIGNNNQFVTFKNEEFKTLLHQQQQHYSPQQTAQFQTNSAKNTLYPSTYSHHHHLSISTNNQYGGGGSNGSTSAVACGNTVRRSQKFKQQNHEVNQRMFPANNNTTIQYEETGAVRSGRHSKNPSKSVHPSLLNAHQKKKIHQQSSSAPKHIIHHQGLVKSNNQQPINISNTKKQLPVTLLNNNQRKRAADLSTQPQQISSSVQNQSRSRSQKRRTTQPPQASQRYQSVKGETTTNTASLKPPKQPGGSQLNKSSITTTNNQIHKKMGTLEVSSAGGLNGVDLGLSFENKENHSVNYNDFSPSRVADGVQGEVVCQRKNGNILMSNFLDSDSSLSSPKNQSADHQKRITRPQGVTGVSSSGPQTGKENYKDKNTFLRHFSPERLSVSNGHHEEIKQIDHGTLLSQSERERTSSRGKYNHNQNRKGNGKKDSDIHDISSNHGVLKARIHLKIVDKLMKEKFKHLKAKEDAEDNQRRKNLEDQIIQKQLMKKAEIQQFSQRAAAQAAQGMNNYIHLNKKIVSMAQQCYNHNGWKHHHQHKGSHGGCGQIKHRAQQTYKRHRSKSCMNKTDNIFCGLPRSKERQLIIQQAAELNQEGFNQAHQNIPKANNDMSTLLKVEHFAQHPQKQESQPRQPTQQPKRNREKSFVLEMKELKRVCIEEIKKDILAGKIDGMPTTSATGFASNKRQSNMTTIVHNNKDSKQNNSAQTNFQSK